ncbi:MAG: hypothetical protein K2N01_13360 [Lachnospiraceae bacterium]|nr:hypothetical protein [Lachnospiraceae bacterium]
MRYVKIKGKEYPYKCTLGALADLQEKYGSMIAFEQKIKHTEDTGEGKKALMPEPGALWDGMLAMLREGIRIEGAETEPTALMDVIDEEYTIFEICHMVAEEFDRCFAVKNQKTTQGKKKSGTDA